MDALTAACPLCGAASSRAVLREAGWLESDARERLRRRQPGWRAAAGACADCARTASLDVLLERSAAVLHEGVQAEWPLDVARWLGPLPTPLRLRADPRFAGRGITLALVDSGFYPHPDLVRPTNRVRAWVDAGRSPVEAREFGTDESPRWPGWDAGEGAQWHGTMTAVAAAGNGALSHGLYRGPASEADVVLVQARDGAGRIGSPSIARALEWIADHAPDLGIRVVSLSVAADAGEPIAGHPVERAVRDLVDRGIAVVAAAGNDGVRRLVPPATSPEALTVGGLDDRGTPAMEGWSLWHGNYGEGSGGAPKPEIVAPSIHVVAPLLPWSPLAREAGEWFALLAAAERDDPRAAEVEARIAAARLVTPHYQQVEGTSFAAPLAAGALACALEANPRLGPRRARELLIAAAHPVRGAPPERQGAGALDAGRAVALALADRHSSRADFRGSPRQGQDGVTFLLHDHSARQVEVRGAWDGWSDPGLTALEVEPGLWEARHPALAPGDHPYKFLLDGARWLADPANPLRVPDGAGGQNSLLRTVAAG